MLSHVKVFITHQKWSATRRLEGALRFNVESEKYHQTRIGELWEKRVRFVYHQSCLPREISHIYFIQLTVIHTFGWSEFNGFSNKNSIRRRSEQQCGELTDDSGSELSTKKSEEKEGRIWIFMTWNIDGSEDLNPQNVRLYVVLRFRTIPLYPLCRRSNSKCYLCELVAEIPVCWDCSIIVYSPRRRTADCCRRVWFRFHSILSSIKAMSLLPTQSDDDVIESLKLAIRGNWRGDLELLTHNVRLGISVRIDVEEGNNNVCWIFHPFDKFAIDWRRACVYANEIWENALVKYTEEMDKFY